MLFMESMQIYSLLRTQAMNVNILEEELHFTVMLLLHIHPILQDAALNSAVS